MLHLLRKWSRRLKRRGATVKVVTDRPESWSAHDVLAELVHGNNLEPLRDRVADAVTQGSECLLIVMWRLLNRPIEPMRTPALAF
jgi:hypothetical protein